MKSWKKLKYLAYYYTTKKGTMAIHLGLYSCLTVYIEKYENEHVT